MDELRINFNKLNGYDSQLRKNFENYKNCFSDSFFCSLDIAEDEKIIIERMQKKIKEQLENITHNYEKQINSINKYIDEINNIESSLLSGKNNVNESEVHHLISTLPHLENQIIEFGEFIQIAYDKNLSENDNKKQENVIHNKTIQYQPTRDMELDDLIEINVNR